MGGMKIVRGFPPNYDLLAAVFPIRGRRVLFAWGDTIYCSNGAEAGPHKVAHEAIHGARQLQMGVPQWWERYLADPKFRFDEEVPAHIAEYVALCETVSGRGARRQALAQVAKQLASPMYGGLISCERARRVILDGASAARSYAPTM